MYKYIAFALIVSTLVGCDNSNTSTRSNYNSNYGTSSDTLGGTSNPFTQTKGYNEEDALIYGILKSQGYSHEDSARATMKSAGW